MDVNDTKAKKKNREGGQAHKNNQTRIKTNKEKQYMYVKKQ